MAERLWNTDYCPLCGSEKSLYNINPDASFGGHLYCKNCNAKWKWKCIWSVPRWTLIKPSDNGKGVEFLNEEKSDVEWKEIMKETLKQKFQEETPYVGTNAN